VQPVDRELRRIPSLDGLRAVSIILVLIGHGLHQSWVYESKDRLTHFLDTIVENGASAGVSIFFVISGFLITRLLIRERARTGSIHLWHFYVRRMFRIWPACYSYIAVVAILTACGVFKIAPREFLYSIIFVYNYWFSYAPASWVLSHIWSLSVEEQFYLIWPFVFFACTNRMALRFAIYCVLLEPLIRMGCYAVFPSMRGHEHFLTHLRADPLLLGCIAGISFDHPRFQQMIHRLRNWLIPTAAALFVTFVSPMLNERFGGRYSLPFGFSLDALAMTYLVLYVVVYSRGIAGRILNSPLVVHVGWTSPRMVGAPEGSIMAVGRSTHDGTTEVHPGVQALGGSIGQ
jgi:peptidoglycan/LPS O-acetylase OafA/YrhL